ncbi:MAG: hypothetical protein KF773_26530 [Deltaproteobacteria bacterium]|nr:hypothetical protein [Deltaproteobacteria bacterium]
MIRNLFSEPAVSSLSTLHDAPAADPARPPSAPAADPVLDTMLLAILQAPPRPGETIALAFSRKEQALYHLLSTLDVPTSRALHTRLATSIPTDDPLALAFSRFTAERRGRILAYLADVRRRHAQRGRR